jgi:aldose 1-epimerase
MATGTNDTENENTSPQIHPASGEQYELRHGDQHAIIASVGAVVRMYQVGGRDVFVPFGIDEFSPVSNSAILAPWPNRLADGAFTFEGYHGQLAINEVARMNRLHGLVSWVSWDLITRSEDMVILRHDLPPQPGWPYQLSFTVVYALNSHGLQCAVATENIGTTTAPLGIGFHPWLSTGGANLDDCQVRLDAATHVTVDDRLLPTGTEPVVGAYDLRESRPLVGLDLDDAWLDPIYDAEGKSWCILTCPDGKAPAVWADDSLPAWQVCSANHIHGHERFGLAAEPMTCVANAFNTGDLLIKLAPGETHSVTWGALLLDANE